MAEEHAKVYFISDDEFRNITEFTSPERTRPTAGNLMQLLAEQGREPGLSEEQLAQIGHWVSTTYPSIRQGDIINVARDYYFYAGDGNIIPPENGAVPERFTVPTNYTPTYWQIPGEQEVSVLYGHRYHIYLPTDHTFTRDDCFAVGNAVVVPVKLNNEVYYFAGIHYDEPALVDILLRSINNARAYPVPTQRPIIDLPELPKDKVIWPQGL